MINRNNFIRWTAHNFSGTNTDTLMDDMLMNKAYITEGHRAFGPLFFPGENYSFYGNYNTLLTDISFNNMRLGIRRYGEQSILVSNVGTLVKDVVELTLLNQEKYNIIFLIPSFPDLSPGWYEFVVYNNSNNGIKSVSNPIEVEDMEYSKNIAKVFYRHSYNKAHFNYEGNLSYYNIFHLPLIQTGFAIEQDKTQYRNVTNRRLRNIKVYTDFVPKIESYNFDEEAHKAMALLYEHDTIFINRYFVVPKDTYQVDVKNNSYLSKASISVYVDYSIVNPNL